MITGYAEKKALLSSERAEKEEEGIVLPEVKMWVGCEGMEQGRGISAMQEKWNGE